MDILNINWKPNNTLEILLSTGSVITFKLYFLRSILSKKALRNSFTK